MRHNRQLAVLLMVTASLASLTGALARPARAQGAPHTERQLLAASRHVVVAVVEEAAVRRHQQGTLLFTDYSLRVEDRLRGEAPERLRLSLPGGTLGEVTDRTSLSFRLEVGARYLLFLDDLDRPSLRPVVGGPQGAIREAAGFAAAVEEVRAAAQESGETAADATRDDQDARDGGLPALRALIAASAAGGQAGLTPAWDDLVVPFPAVPPIVVNPVPAGAPFAGHDRRQIAYWNTYVPGLFQVASPSRTWAYGNGVSDVAGFPDDAQMVAQFGEPWGPGAFSFVASRIENGHVVEADVALNPAFAWTADEDAATRPGGPFSFPRAILKYLTLAWGLGPSFGIDLSVEERESVTGIAPQAFRLATLYPADVQPALAIYPGPPVRDGLVSSYSLVPAPLAPFYLASRPTPSAVAVGGSFRLDQPVKLENVGSVALANPTVELYLVPKRFSFKKAIFLKRLRPGGSLDPGALRNVTFGPVTVPRSVRPGTYYLAFRLVDPRDRYQANNTAWSSYDVQLEVLRRAP